MTALQLSDDQRHVYVDFYYLIIEGGKCFILQEDMVNNAKRKGFDVKIGRAMLRIPTWLDLYDIQRKSSVRDPYDQGKSYIDPHKYMDNKLKALVKQIITHDGQVYNIRFEDVENMEYGLMLDLVDPINKMIDIYCPEDGLSDQEAQELSRDCYRYYSSINKKQAGDTHARVPQPPSIIILKQVCEFFNCTPNEARKVDRRDIDMMVIAKEQESICSNPSLIGLSNQTTGQQRRGRRKR